ncbi:Cobalt-precorrin-3 C(17)-methyltransferase, partial [hydrothermal vent metagenome]
FVVALYNPKSGRRTQQIVEAQRILLQYRKPETPVAIVKSAYREAQNIQMVRLDEMKDCKIGMLTTVLIGNSSTYMDQGLMITPRGYANKYKDITGDAIEGEKRGRSLTMGLVGWKDCVREFLRGTNDYSLRDLASHFNSSTGEIISAISEAGEDDSAGEYSATKVQQAPSSVIEAAKNWGLLRAVVRSEAGAISELMVHAEDFKLRGDWLNIENNHFHLHVNWANVQQAWFVKRGKKLCSVHFTDEKNETVFNVSLVREDNAYNADALQAYEADWKTLSILNGLEK